MEELHYLNSLILIVGNQCIDARISLLIGTVPI